MSTRRNRPGRPRDPEVDRAILTHALRLLSRQGYEAMSIEGVAAAAGVGKATIYRRYSDKRELTSAALSLLGREAPELTSSGDIRTDLVAAASKTLRYLAGVDAFTLIGTLLTQARENPEFLELFREHVLWPRRRALQALLKTGVRRGQLSGESDLERLIDALAGSIFVRHLSGLPLDEPTLESIVDFVVSSNEAAK